ncbi:DNA-binding transcriptional LysR family regulator [Alloalcanivorax xenomutans]|nr:DNA-binding transcriptional LysR family regulator [Alloalcanivorax xenomutans]
MLGKAVLMSLETTEISVFVSVVKLGSFARAAQEHGMTPSGVSRVVSRLEERLAVRLLQRSTRRLSLTESGAVLFRRGQRVLQELQQTESEVTAASRHPKGVIRVNAPVVFGRQHIVPLLKPLRDRYPELSIELELSDRFIDLIDGGVDLAIRIGALEDYRLVARRLCANRRLLVASPAYIRRHGVPREPKELSDHQCLIFTALEKPRHWRLQGPEGTVSVPVAGPVVCNNGEVLTEAAKAGLGIAMGVTFSIADALLSGDLVRVLPEYEFEPSAVHAVYPSARQLSRKVRAVVDFLAESLPGPPSWDLALRGKVVGFEPAP